MKTTSFEKWKKKKKNQDLLAKQANTLIYKFTSTRSY